MKTAKSLIGVPKVCEFELFCAMLVVGFWLQAVHVEIDDWRCEEGKQLADDQSADDGDPQRPPEFRSCAGAEGQRKAPNIAAKVVIMIGRKRSMQA